MAGGNRDAIALQPKLASKLPQMPDAQAARVKMTAVQQPTAQPG